MESIEKNYDHLKAEPQAQALWEKHNVYSTENNPGPLYSIDTTTSNRVWLFAYRAHILLYPDRYHCTIARMKGNCVFYPFGFDEQFLAMALLPCGFSLGTNTIY